MKNSPTWHSSIWNDATIIRKMKLTTFFSFVMTCGIWATPLSQSTKISLNLENASVSQFIKSIEEKTDFYFIYQDNVFKEDQMVSINVDKMPLDAVLAEFEKQTSVVVKVFDYQIVMAKNRSEVKKILESVNATIKPIQQIQVKGKVTFTDGMPLPGANIIEKGTTNGTQADFDGNFTLSVASKNAILVVSYIGYATREISLNGQTNLNIVLQEDAAALDEIVVVGYGTRKKETLTGSVSSVSGEVVKSPTANVTASLQGRLPGITATQRTGEPGRDDPSILIRATATLGANAPLIIIDGVQRSSMGQLNPEDVENFSILKGASAAIYGARAANGVILITTKSGRIGKPKFSLSVNTAITNPTMRSEMLGSPLYAEVYNEGQLYDQDDPNTPGYNPRPGYVPFYTDQDIEKYRNGSDTNSYPNTDWVNEVLKNNAMQNRVNLEVTGGSENTKYLMSFAALTQEGNYKNNPTNYNQYNMRSKFDVDLTNNFNVGANISAIVKNKEFSSQGVGVNFINILLASPTDVAVYDNGLIAPGRFGQSPLLLDRRGYNHTDEIPIFSTFTATYKVPFVEGLKIDASYNYDLETRTSKTWDLPYTSNLYDVNTGEYPISQVGIVSPVLTERYDKLTTKLYNFRLTYDKTFGDHTLSAMIGQEQQVNKSSWIQAYRRNYVSPSIAEINVGSNAADDKDNSGTSSETSRNNYFSRLEYNYKSKYFADFVFRREGSQNFPKDSRYGNFYAISGAWRLSEENFIKDNFKNIDQLKLRIDHGLSGNDNVDAFQHLQTFNFGSNYVFGSTDVPGITEGKLANPFITWEKARKTDVGLEGLFWNGLFGFDLTVWKEHRYDILINEAPVVPVTYGLPGFPDVNSGIVDSHGYELILTHKNTINELQYSITGNISYADSEVIFKNETPRDEAYQNETGLMVGAGLYYETDGIYNTQEELDASVHHRSTKVGDVVIVDVNEDGAITEADQIRINKTNTPKYIFGMDFGFNYKNFDLNLFFQGQAAAVNYDSRYANLGNANFENSFVLRAEDRWTVDNINGTKPRSRGYLPGDNTFFLQDASFVRLKFAEFGYTLPEKAVSKVGLTSTRIYLNGSNLLTWAKEIKHVDPEISGQANYYPQVRTINVGVNLNF
ncbi:TonB-linked SusC/RagA family outer membrane protein [Mariniflexile fucanivorans]|uniref:TonB-linked SusC/RagA family outer membrane protein n=1 Tax=Mariniflexile fucanivorans TaxID=264023 RepID=A0A4R1RJQ5_9FLAO|nr:TonB-dependent receptor [Mariniflexile fucanivorans]TCL66236.1 TonB-linked SusC/RagA family outer membrane protein [Mariniflexile fucanivorans]